LRARLHARTAHHLRRRRGLRRAAVDEPPELALLGLGPIVLRLGADQLRRQARQARALRV
jgi:hypothetical protein